MNKSRGQTLLTLSKDFFNCYVLLLLHKIHETTHCNVSYKIIFTAPILLVLSAVQFLYCMLSKQINLQSWKTGSADSYFTVVLQIKPSQWHLAKRKGVCVCVGGGMLV